LVATIKQIDLNTEVFFY